jgi:hypothetical protein
MFKLRENFFFDMYLLLAQPLRDLALLLRHTKTTRTHITLQQIFFSS